MKIGAYKTEGHNVLRGHWTPAVLTTLLLFAISMTVSGYSQMSDSWEVISSGCILTFFVMLPLSVGYYNAFLAAHDGDYDMVKNMFKLGFSNYLHVVGGYLIMCVKTFLWTLLLIVPGVIKALAYAMTPFILVDMPEVSAAKASSISSQMMKGHKWQYFVLCLSFIGWGLLCVLTLGIGTLWLEPYIYSTCAAFYKDIKAEYLSKQVSA